MLINNHVIMLMAKLKVPDDITVLFTDDNYGNLVTVQDPEKLHRAGAGMYYHVDCQSFPSHSTMARVKLTMRCRPSKGLQVDQHHQPRQEYVISVLCLLPILALTIEAWEQMSVARAFNTTAIWILNVGTLKPLELPVEHYMSLAWDLDAWPVNSVDRFLIEWATREFGEEVSEETADIMKKYSVCRSHR